MSDIKVIPASQINWSDYRDLRLEALKLEPQAFGSSYEDQKNDSQAAWEFRLNRYIEGNGNWMLFAAKDKKIIGMMGAFQAQDDIKNNTAQIIAVYVKKKHRGKGISKTLFSSLLKLLNQSNIKKVKLSVNIDQVAAVSLYKKFGFKITNQERNKLGDRLFHDEYVMELDLVK